MTPPIQPVADPYAKMREYAQLMREFGPMASIDTEARELVQLAQMGYKTEAAGLAASRQQANERDMRAANAGPLAAGLVGGMQGLAGAEGFSAGMAGGAMVAPFTGPFAPAMPILGGIVGAIGGSMAVKPGLAAAGVAPEQLKATEEANPGSAFIGNIAGGLALPAGQFGRALFTKTTQAAEKATADATIAKSQAAVSDRVANAQALRAEADATLKRLQVQEQQRLMSNPERAASSSARHARIRAESRKAIADASKAEAEAIMTQARAAGQMGPAELAKLELLHKNIARAELQLEVLRQNAAVGSLSPQAMRTATEQAALKLRVLESTLQQASAKAGVAGEEAATKLAILKEQLKYLQGRFVEPLPLAPGSTPTGPQ